MHLAAGYQLWGALLTPVMIPLVVFAAGKLYDRTIWIPPRELLLDIAEKQFLPLLLGMALAHFWPAISAKLQPVDDHDRQCRADSGDRGVSVQAWPHGAEVADVWLPVAALVLAVGSVLAIRFCCGPTFLTDRTLAICNANRHVGLALLLTGHFLQAERALPAVAAYALVAPFVMAATSKWFHHGEHAAQPAVSVMQSDLVRGTIELCLRARFAWSTKRTGSASRVR